MADVLVDTSIWVDFFRRGATAGWRPVLVDLLERDAVVLVDPVVAELLYGVRGERERSVILDLAGSVRRAPLALETWIAAGDLGRAWRARGRTLSLVDCLVATVAIRDGLQVWTLDTDFDPLTEDGRLRRFSRASPRHPPPPLPHPPPAG